MKKLTISTAKQSKGTSIMDRVKSFEDACEVTGMKEAELTVSGQLEDDYISLAAYAKMIIIARALNEGWVPDWANDNQPKYYPWFDMSSGSGLRCFGYAYQRSISHVGSRLCFKSMELAEYAAKQFNDIYSDLFIIKTNS